MSDPSSLRGYRNNLFLRKYVSHGLNCRGEADLKAEPFQSLN